MFRLYWGNYIYIQILLCFYFLQVSQGYGWKNTLTILSFVMIILMCFDLYFPFSGYETNELEGWDVQALLGQLYLHAYFIML